MWIVIPDAMPVMRVSPQVSRPPFWLDTTNPLENYPWQQEPSTQLPDSVDTVVIGAGFTGASAAYRNADLIEQTVRDEGFDVDYARNGWVQERRADQQDALAESVREAARTGNHDWISIDPERVSQESGMRVDFPAGFSARAGTWHWTAARKRWRGVAGGC